VLEAAKLRGEPAATLAASGDDARRLAAEGWDFVMVSSDTGLLAQAAGTAVTTARAHGSGELAQLVVFTNRR
jgi:2-keto-3-deoxy-L-rhamnonate aldolase RhmA